MEKVKRNAARCLSCAEVIESKSRHDFKWCGCGKIAVDGGLEYIRRVGDFNNMEDLSEFETDETE